MKPPAASQSPLRLKPATLNPYKFGARLIYERLLWDLHPQSFRSRFILRSWKDRYKGQKCVILCNGPSLLNVDFELIQNHGVFCFGLNKINLLFERTAFRPNAVVAVNPQVIEQNAPFFNDTSLPLFLHCCALRHVSPRKNIAYLHSTQQVRFARDCSVSIQEGFTVTFVALELAFHMGFQEVALVGCDHSFSTEGPPHQLVTAGDEDPNHFDPRYFSGGMQWGLPDLRGSEYFYDLARQVYEAFGRKILNATKGGRLSVFERRSLGDFLKRECHPQRSDEAHCRDHSAR